MYAILSLYNYSTVLFYYSDDGRHTTRTRPGKLHTATGRCPGQRTRHALVAYSGMDEESTRADRRHPPARPWGYALPKTMSDIDQALLQLINVMNLVDLLLHFSPYFVISLAYICGVGVSKGLMKWTQVSVVPEGWLSHTRGEQQWEHCFVEKYRTRHTDLTQDRQ